MVDRVNKIDLLDLVAKDKRDIEDLNILNENDRKRLGNIVIKQIRERTQSGRGVRSDGQEYSLQDVPYSAQYAAQKGSSRVDLTLSGDMLENMFVKSTGSNSVSISVRKRDEGKLQGAEEGIRRLKRDSKGKPIGKSKETVKRPFFHLSERDKDAIVNDPEFERIFNRALRRLESKKRSN